MENEKPRRKMTAFEITFAIVAITIPLLVVYIIKIKETKCDYYRKGLQMGMELAEEHCYKFNEDEYVGSDEWIKKHNPKLFDEIESHRETGDYGCIGLEQSFLEKLLGD